jgi:hypothetical protein
MATTETISSNYAGEAASKFFSNVLLAPTTITNGGVSFQDGIRYKWNLPTLNMSGIIGNASCDFTDIGTVTRAERVLTVEGAEVNLKLCKSKYRPTFDPMGASYWSGLAPEFASHLIGLVGSNVAQNRELTIWQGATATVGEFDGFETIFTDEALQPAAYEIAGTTVTAANVIAQLQLVVNAADSALYSNETFAIRVGTNIIKHYIAAQAALGYLDRYNVDKTELNFQGVPLIHCAGMSDDVMFATYADNLYYGIGEAGDAQRVDVIDQQPLDGSDNVNVVMKWADGVVCANPADVITYGITNAGN